MIYLGEIFCSYTSINNSSSFEDRDVVIKVMIFYIYFSNYSHLKCEELGASGESEN